MDDGYWQVIQDVYITVYAINVYMHISWKSFCDDVKQKPRPKTGRRDIRTTFANTAISQHHNFIHLYPRLVWRRCWIHTTSRSHTTPTIYSQNEKNIHCSSSDRAKGIYNRAKNRFARHSWQSTRLHSEVTNIQKIEFDLWPAHEYLQVELLLLYTYWIFLLKSAD